METEITEPRPLNETERKMKEFEEMHSKTLMYFFKEYEKYRELKKKLQSGAML